MWSRRQKPGTPDPPVPSHPPPAYAPIALTGIKVVHTAAWAGIEACMLYVLYAGLRNRSDRRVAIAAGVVAGESLVFAANGFRCPLTDVAENLGATHASVTDIYLPTWFAHNLPAIHVPLIALAVALHAPATRRRRSPSPDRVRAA